MYYANVFYRIIDNEMVKVIMKFDLKICIFCD